MSGLTRFMKQNKKQRENTKFAATKSLVDDKGNTLLWTIRPLMSSEIDKMRDDCTMEIPVSAKKGLYRSKVDATKFLCKLMCASIVEPDLHDKALQDSYGVMTPEALLQQMIDDPGEYNALGEFIQEFNNLDKALDDIVDEAKK